MLSLLKSNHTTLPDKTTPKLHTPVGSYYSRDILEGFAADAEYLASMPSDTGSHLGPPGIEKLRKASSQFSEADFCNEMLTYLQKMTHVCVLTMSCMLHEFAIFFEII